MKRRVFIFILMILPSILTFASDFSYLLEKYLEADYELAKKKLELEQSRIELEKYNIQNGINFSVTTGKSTLYRDGSDTVLKMEPSATVEIPDEHNTEFSASVPLIVGGSDQNAGTEIKVSRDLVPFKKTTAVKVNRMAYERSVIEKERNYTSRCNEAEAEFLQKLRDLYTIWIDVMKFKDDMNQADEDFQVAVAQGYTSAETEYQNKELLLRTARREYQEKIRLLEQGLKELGDDCRIEITELPENIPDVELLLMNEFDLEKYKEYENALWNQYLNAKERESTEPGFKLNGNLGYAYGDMGSNDYLREKNHSILTGFGVTWGSLAADVGLKIPVTDIEKTALSFAVTWTPNQDKLDKLTNEYNHLASEHDQISVEDALDKYNKKLDSMETELKDLQWKKVQYGEEEELYRQMYQKYEKYYESGVVTKLKKDQSLTDYEESKVKNLALKLDCLIYNKNLINLFIQE